jgi:hypothetical protein
LGGGGGGGGGGLVRYSSTSNKGLLFCTSEVCQDSKPYLDRLWFSLGFRL